VTATSLDGEATATRSILIRVPPAALRVTITGPREGKPGSSNPFIATVGPPTTTLPLTYTWQATGQQAVVHAGRASLTDLTGFTWRIGGVKAVTVTVSNAFGAVSGQHVVLVGVPPSLVTVTGPAAGVMGGRVNFSATTSPITTSLPITYTWHASGEAPVIHVASMSLVDTAPLAWRTTGTKAITVTLTNVAGSVMGRQSIVVGARLYLPLTFRTP
jgi:hypothetical protein